MSDVSVTTMGGIPTILVIENRLYRLAMTRLLSENGFDVIQCERNPSEIDLGALKDDKPESVLIVISATCYDINTTEKIQYFDNTIDNSKILVLSDAFSKVHMRECLSAGAAGYLLPDCDEQVFIESLRLVYRGQNVFPADLAFGKASRSPHGDRDFSQNEFDNALDNLDKMEMKILQMLVSGMINKEMERELSMKDDKLKFYLYRLLKKIGVTNRVQAAVWAVHNGIPSYEPNTYATKELAASA